MVRGTPWGCVIPTQVNLSLFNASEYSVENPWLHYVRLSFFSLRTSLFLRIQVVSIVPAAGRCLNFVSLLHLSKTIIIASSLSW